MGITTIKTELEQIKHFLRENKSKSIIVLIMYLATTIAIGLTNFPYIDDIGRQLLGYSGFSEHYSRYLSEFSSVLIQGQRHLTDLGLTTNIVSALIMTACSLLMLYIFFGNQKISWLAFLSAAMVGLNPWFLEVLSFRFDSPYISLSVLVTILPFLFWKAKPIAFFGASTFGIFLMCNSYQASSGVFILMTLTLVFLHVCLGQPFKSVQQRILLAMAAFISGLALYLIQIQFLPPVFSEASDIGPILGVPKNMLTNTLAYFSNIISQSANIWLLLAAVILLLFSAKFILSSPISKLQACGYLAIYLILGSILSYGVYIIFPETLALLRPRYEYGMGVFGAIIMMLTSQNLFDKKIFRLNLVAVGLLVYYFFSFSFVYAASLSQQNDFFTSQVNLLANSLNQINPENRTIKMNRFLDNSPIYDNSALNYPILHSLIMPNTNISWDMTDRFNSISNLQVDFQLFNEAELNLENTQLLEETILYNVYSENDQIYVIMK